MALHLTFARITESEFRALSAWCYPSPYDIYNLDPNEAQEDLRTFLDPANGYHCIRDDIGERIGHCCFGPDARVPGGGYGRDIHGMDALDVGMGLHPDLTGRGFGASFVSAVLDFGREAFDPARFRHVR